MFALGKHGKHENVIRYSSLSLLRKGTTEAYKTAQRKGQLRQFYFELFMYLASFTVFCILSWKYVLFFFLTVFWAGWFLAHMENYYEHYGAQPLDTFADSISYYGGFYNFLFCNEGYHQEHHLRPQRHWTHRPDIKKEFTADLDAANCLISRVPPLLGFLERRPNHAFGPTAETVLEQKIASDSPDPAV